jgi:hypothetical protein
LEQHPPDVLVTLDITQLVEGEYESNEAEPDHFIGRVPTIVLTEGRSDARILREVVNVLFPEYGDFLSFIDYETANPRGGTDELVQFVKMFVGCGIKNRIVVLFDNDAAGHDALARLGKELPPNVFPMCLPPMQTFGTYPTLGPDGLTTSDIDGRACSLELYLGRDALTDPATGGLRPVRWAGFAERIGRYQGQITGKGQVQDRFLAMLAEIRDDPTKRGQFDLVGVEAVFEAVIAALAAR